ncbi:hypothetical protein [Clostridium saccharoperbutylacetonicum]
MKKILDTELFVSKIDEKTHEKIIYYIEEEMTLMRIEFEYSPKTVSEKKYIIEAFNDDRCQMSSEEVLLFKEKYLAGNEELKNLATLSLYYENEYIGCSHKSSDKQTIIISQEESSPGFKNIKVNQGQWKIVISMHGLHSNMNISLKAYVG